MANPKNKVDPESGNATDTSGEINDAYEAPGNSMPGSEAAGDPEITQTAVYECDENGQLILFEDLGD